MAATSITSSATLTQRSPIEEGPRKNSIQVIAQLTVVNSEVITINHFTDTLKIRSIRVMAAATGIDAAVAAGGIVSALKTDADTSTITFGASAAGDWIIVIEN